MAETAQIQPGGEMNKRNRRKPSAGFTLVELMVVIALIAMIAVFAVPRISRSVAKTKVTDAVNALSSVSAQIESICAGKSAMPKQATVDAMLGGNANGYKVPSQSGGCTDFTVNLSPEDEAALPKLCIKKTADGLLKYGWSLPKNSGLSDDDIPVPAGRAGQTCA